MASFRQTLTELNSDERTQFSYLTHNFLILFSFIIHTKMNTILDDPTPLRSKQKLICVEVELDSLTVSGLGEYNGKITR